MDRIESRESIGKLLGSGCPKSDGLTFGLSGRTINYAGPSTIWTPSIVCRNRFTGIIIDVGTEVIPFRVSTRHGTNVTADVDTYDAPSEKAFNGNDVTVCAMVLMGSPPTLGSVDRNTVEKATEYGTSATWNNAVSMT